jgi:hypothetical protein
VLQLNGSWLHVSAALRPSSGQLVLIKCPQLLKHSNLFRHFLAILRQFVVSTLSSHTSMSNAAVGNRIYNLILFHMGFMLLKSHCLKSLKYLNCLMYNKMGKNRLLKCVLKMWKSYWWNPNILLLLLLLTTRLH